MHSMHLTFFLIVLVCSLTAQPTFFRSTFKGLGDIVSNPSVLANDEIRVVYYHEQTVAVINLGPSNELRDCNIIEVYEPSEATEVLRNLSMTLQPQVVSFQEITRLMQQCELLDKLQVKATSALPTNALSRAASSITLFSGILPGTKWCGTGDIAENYHDLGDLSHIDRCCRTHDLCPIKVRAQQTRYNLTNYSLYTKSHCICDKTLYQCLKAANHPTANLMGQIYFNIIKVPCIEDTRRNLLSRKFVPVKKEY
ncbi:Phospholipase A2 isozymes PA3A/PA3B/PA5 [Formica fusca]